MNATLQSVVEVIIHKARDSPNFRAGKESHEKLTTRDMPPPPPILTEYLTQIPIESKNVFLVYQLYLMVALQKRHLMKK